MFTKEAQHRAAETEREVQEGVVGAHRHPDCRRRTPDRFDTDAWEDEGEAGGATAVTAIPVRKG